VTPYWIERYAQSRRDEDAETLRLHRQWCEAMARSYREPWDDDACYENSGGMQTVYGPWPALPDAQSSRYPGWTVLVRPPFSCMLDYLSARREGVESPPLDERIQQRCFHLERHWRPTVRYPRRYYGGFDPSDVEFYYAWHEGDYEV
jgi:hypothetical protein